jgi:hypothetical protein
MRALEKKSYRAVPAEFYGTPKELWGFRSKGRGRPIEIARRFLAANSRLLGLTKDLSGLRQQKIIYSLGASHVIFQQIHMARRVHRGFVTAHVGNDGGVYLVKNRAVPADLLPAQESFRLSLEELIRRARRSLPKSVRRAEAQDIERLWFPEEERLLPAARVRLARRRPAEEWIVYVNAATGGILSRYDNLAEQIRGSAQVFVPSPVTALRGHATLLTRKRRPRRPPAATYRTVDLLGLSGSGYLEGEHVTTRPSRRRVRRADHRFLFESRERGFEESMAYYHVDSAVRYLARLGFRGTRAIFRQPLEVDATGTREDNSWYSPWDRRITFGTGAIDDAEDAETILHELGHAIQDAIVPDFGQSEEAAAMGEGFGDYFAASFFAARKPERYRPCVMTWDGLLDGLKYGLDPPCLRRLDNDWTYDDFDPDDDEHDNGEIWSAALWDVRERLGRRTADRLIVESHFQLDGFTTFARGARAILDADRNLNGGANGKALRQVFRSRRIGPVG